MKSQKDKIGIDFIDNLMQGGLPSKTALLIEGTSGIGQNVMLYQFLYEGIKNNEKCIYLFSGHMIDEIMDEFESYGIEIKEKDIVWIDASSSNENAIQCDLSELYTVSSAIKNVISSRKKNEKIRFATDAVSPMLMANNPGEVYKFLSSLITELKKADAQSMFIIEDAMHEPQVTASIEQLCDGVIELKAIERDLEIETVMKIKKMKNIPPFQKYFKYKVTEEGIVEKRE
ncbi:MAG: ATPase domain-containing protein [Candidatus Micrarchaeia archaeon]